jgi:predicted regulator of Ras-like GTPase activity (Roadblock/LC7/MglB family)
MDIEVYSFALKNALNEIQNICPDIKNAFMFREDGEVIAGDVNTPEETIAHVVEAFDSITEKADAIGDIESITLDSTKGRVNITCLNDLYLATVTNEKADMVYVKTVTRVLIPTILNLLDKINPVPAKNDFPKPPTIDQEPELSPVRKTKDKLELTEETDPEELDEPRQIQPEIEPRSLMPEPPVNQFIVENIGGLLVPSDTVRIDNEIITQWLDLYPEKKIVDVDVETFGGQSVTCKVKPIKDSKYEGKGIIQMPDKIQVNLGIKKGELVRVKPVIH